MEKPVDVRAFYRFMANIYGIPLSILNEGGALVEQYAADPGSAGFLLSFADLQARIFSLCAQAHKPQVISSELGQLWAGIPLVEGGRLDALIVLGPVFTSGGATNIMLDYVRAYNISAVPREKLLAALNQTPVCSYTEFARLIAIVYAFTFGEELDTTALPIAGLARADLPPAPGLLLEEKPAARVENAPDPTYALGQRLMECVGEGSLEKLKRLLRTINYAEIHYTSLPDPIRQQKNMFISLIAQVLNVAVQAGLNPAVAYALQDRYIQQVESLKNMIPIVTLTREMLYDFTTRVGRLKRPAQYSKLVNDCCAYIEDHVYENLRVTDVAAFAGHNAHYLGQKFRAETGQSLGDYIRAAKIAEARSLLRYTPLSLAEISEQLAFSSQSFFTAAFRQATGLTPGQFREQAD